MRDYPTYLILAVFIASGVSFFDELLARMLVRMTTVVVGIVAAFALALGVSLALAFAADWNEFLFGPNGLHLIGSVLLILYFGICAVTCVPLAPARRLRAMGLVLHFLLMPAGFFLTTFSPLPLPLEIRISAWSHNLALGLTYAMLWFRMLEKQTAYRLAPTPIN